MKDSEHGGTPEDDNFGLPDPDFKPLEELEAEQPSTIAQPPAPEELPATQEISVDSAQHQEFPEDVTSQSEEVHESNRYLSTSFDDDSGKKIRVILAILVPILVLVSLFFVYQYWVAIPNQKQEEIERAMKLKEAEEKAKRARESKIKEVPVIQAPEPVALGTVEILQSQTGRWHVVINSSIDGDLIMDRAKKLTTEGISTNIIPPYGKWKFHRLAITSDSTFTLAQQKADQLKEKYGQDLWVMRY
jgi:hypothetical protein